MRSNPVQFAVVREDPALEAELIRATGAQRVLLVASGGCTALSLLAMFPGLTLTLVDPNPAQLELVRKKTECLRQANGAERARLFNVECDDRTSLNQCGNFESLFRGLRELLFEFVASPREMRALFDATTPDAARAQLVANLVASPYWSVAFEMFFCDRILRAMFGPEATQHAEPGSYPSYFRSRFERALSAAGAHDNYFLHHVLLGCYIDRPASLPWYLAQPAPAGDFELVRGRIEDVPDLGRFDLISLSNVTDWMSDDAAGQLARHLTGRMRPGSTVLWRQLNNTRDLRAQFGPAFEFDPERDARLLDRDRSLFYCAVGTATKRRT